MTEVIAALAAIFTVLTLVALSFAGIRKYLEKRRRKKEVSDDEKKAGAPEKTKKEAAEKGKGDGKLSVIIAVIVTVALLVLTVALLYPQAGAWIWSHTKILGIGAGITALLVVLAINTNRAPTLTAVSFILVIGLFGVAVYDTLKEENIIKTAAKPQKGKSGTSLASLPKTPTKLEWWLTQNSPTWQTATLRNGSARITDFVHTESFVRYEYKAVGATGVCTWDKRQDSEFGKWTLVRNQLVLNEGICNLYKDGNRYSGTIISYYDERGKLLPRGVYGQSAITISY